MSVVKTPKPANKVTKSEHLQVFVRVRPLNDAEIAHKSHTAVTIKGAKEVVVNDHTTPKISKTYTFDSVFGPNAQQAEIYQRVAAQAVSDVLAGFNCTVFAYGQTGSGKTYTMEGDLLEGDQSTKAGLIPRAMTALFDELRLQRAEFVVRISFIELYNEELYDLFAPDEVPPKLRLYDDPAKKGSVVIQPLEEAPVHSKKQVMEFLKKGLAKRTVAATQMNAHSSRSHTVFCATVHTKENNLEGEELVKFGKLYLVDLAGSENIGRSGSVDKRAREAGSINQSLLTLGRVINCLVERQPHVPYRESKLTRVLQDSLGGRTKTSIIATVSPAASNVEETICTLDYASKAKSVNNRPEVNQRVSKEAVVKEYAVLIDDLKSKLNLTREGSGIYLANENYRAFKLQEEERERSLSEKIAEIRVCGNEIKKYEILFTELSNQLSCKEERLASMKQDLEQTAECVLKTKVELAEENDKLAETAELVQKADHYESDVHSQAKALIGIVGECQEDSVQIYSRVDNSEAAEKHNIGYGVALVEEADRLKESFRLKKDEFVAAAISLQNLGERLRSLKSGNDAEMKDLKNLVYSTYARIQPTFEKILAVREDQMDFKFSWDEETVAETKERCEERLKALVALEAEVGAAFETYVDLITAIGEMKGRVAKAIYDTHKEWLELVDKTIRVAGKGLGDALRLWDRQLQRGEQAFSKVEATANQFSGQEKMFEKEKSEALDGVLRSIANLEEVLVKHEAAGAGVLAEMGREVEQADDVAATAGAALAVDVHAVEVDTERTISADLFGVSSLKKAVAQHTAQEGSRITSFRSILLESETASQLTCSENLTAWQTLASATEEALEARARESADTRQAENTCCEEMRNELAELKRKYAEAAEKIRRKYEKFGGESESCLDRVSDASAVISSDLKESLKTTSTLVQTYVHDQFQRDCPSGQTPPRKDMRIPPLREPLSSPEVRRIVIKINDQLKD